MQVRFLPRLYAEPTHALQVQALRTLCYCIVDSTRYFVQNECELGPCRLYTDSDQTAFNLVSFFAKNSENNVLNDLIFSGQPIPRIEYTPDEIATWKEVYTKAVDLLPGRACTTFRKALTNMIKECGFSPDNIPQMEDVSNYLKSKKRFLHNKAALEI